MFYVLQNESVAARRRVPILLTDAATGTTAQSGVALTTIYAYVNSNGGSFAGGAGTVANSGFGQYYYEFHPDEISTLGLAGIHVTALACRDYDAIAQVAALDFYSAAVGITAGSVWNYVLSNSDTAETNLVNASAGGGATAYAIAQEVWNTDLSAYDGSVPNVAGWYQKSTFDTVTNYLDANVGDVPNQVWSFDISSRTDPSAGFNLYQLGIGATGYASGGGLTAGDVWEYDISAISTAGTAGSQLNLSASGSGASTYSIAEEVWNFDISEFVSGAGGYVVNINGNVNDAKSNTNNIPLQVWGDDLAAGANSPYAAGTAGTILYELSLGGSGISAADVWSYVDRTITGGAVTSVTDPVTVSTSSMTGIAGTVWSTDVSGYSSPSAGFDLANASAGGGISAYDVWNFDATGMSSPQQGAALTDTLANTTSILSDITGIPNNVWVQDITGFASPEQAGFNLYQLGIGATGYSAGSALTAGDVWSYATREITGGIADTVTSVTNGVIVTTNNDKTGYELSGAGVSAVQSGLSTLTQAQVGTEVDSSLSDVGLTSTVTGRIDVDVSSRLASSSYVTPPTEASIAGTVWTYATRTLTSATGISAYDVWNFDPTAMTSPQAGAILTDIQTDTNTIITDIGNVPNNVWASDVSGYVNPGEAGFELTQAASGSGLTSGDVSVAVWDADPVNYSNNSTFGKGILRSDNAGVAGTVTLWTGASYNGVYADAYRIDADYGAATALKNVLTGIGSSITSNITGDLSGSVGSVTADVNVTTDSMTGIAGTVWTYATRTLTSGGSGISAYDVWNFVLSDSNTAEVDLVQAAAGSGLTAGDVWSAPSRTITGGIADTVSNVTGNVSGSVGSVLGNVSGNVVGSVGSVTGDVSGNVVGSVANVTGNVSGSVGSVLGNVSGNVVGSVASVTGNVSGNVVGSVGSVTGNVAGTVAAVTGNVSGNVVGSVGSVTGNVAGSVNSVVTDVSVDESLISADVWSYVSRTLTSSGSGISAADVWTYATRTITGGIADTVSNVTGNVVGSVGSVLGNVSGNVVGTVGSVTGNVSGNVVGSVASVLGNVSGNVVGSVASVTGNVAGSVASVTGNVVGSVGSVTGNVAGSVASVTNPVIFDSAQYASIASSVWNAATRTLTSGGSGISAYDVWNFVLSDTNTAEVDLVQAASGAGLTAGDVWTYGSREITGGLADTVTSITNPVTVGTNNDKTGYALSAGGVTAVQSGLSTLTQAQVGTEVDSSLSDVGLTSTVTGRIDVAVSSRLASSSYEIPPTAASIASSVWSAGSRTITGGTVDNLTNPATVATSSMTGIAGTVWNYSTRTITSGGGATAGDVWTYPTRSLTSGAGITVNAATNIINGPYFVKSNVDGQDGNLDVITGMVQDIQLTVTDAFGNPFDTTALGLAVNFYNQAGTLTTSYGTSQLYGPAGLVQFTLDTAVTGVEGRYNLILSAAGAGNTIKFGPLTTLVRPY